MAESFLEEQLARIRRLNEYMSEAWSRAAAVSDELSRGREFGHFGPLDEVRDYRPYCAVSSAVPPRSIARKSSRRKRRR